MATTTTMPGAEPTTIGAGNSSTVTIVGWLLTGLGGSFLLFDGLNHLVQPRSIRDGSAVIGWPPEANVWIAIIELVLLAIYLVPRTSVLGAILLTAYLSGAVGADVRVAAPLFGDLGSAGFLGIVLWVALCLRNPQLRRLVPFGR